MKKLIMIIYLMMAFSMMVAPVVMADTISTGDYVKLTAYNISDGAGIMTYAVSHDPTNAHSVAFSYDTFCIQDNVYVYYSSNPNEDWYYVASISSNVGYVSPNSPVGAGPLQGAVDYLFYRYKSGAYDLSSQADQADLQKLLWSIQGTGLPYTSAPGAQWSIDYAAYNIAANGPQHSWGTEVINIVGYDSTGTRIDIQNQLYNQVPEPATMLLLAIGLMGLAEVRRKIKK